jgi:hypothetical protein
MSSDNNIVPYRVRDGRRKQKMKKKIAKRIKAKIPADTK